MAKIAPKGGAENKTEDRSVNDVVSGTAEANERKATTNKGAATAKKHTTKMYAGTGTAETEPRGRGDNRTLAVIADDSTHSTVCQGASFRYRGQKSRQGGPRA